MPRKKIIILSNGYMGGATEFLKQHIDFLLKEKNQITLIDDNPKKNFKSVKGKIKVFKLDVNRPTFFSRNQINQILNNNEKDSILFITNFAFLIKYFFILNKFKKKNIIVLTIHSGILKLNIKNYIAGFLFSFLYFMPTIIFFGSNSSKMWWQSKYPWMRLRNNKIIYNGIAFNKNKIKKLKKKNINISFIGRLEKENNPDFFLKIANSYQNRNYKVKFNIFGDGPLFSELKINNNNKKIIFHGWCKKNYIYTKSDIVIITSKVNNFPYVALESMSYGIPIISCSKGDIRYMIKNGKNGFIKYTKSSKEIENLINKVINDYNNFSKNALINIKNFDVNKSMKKFWKYLL